MKVKLTLCFLLLITSLPSLAKEKIRLGYLEYPPEIYTSENKVAVGPLVDFLSNVLAPNYEVEWLSIPVARVRWSFENHVIDAFPFLVKNKKHEEWAHFFEKPYASIQNIICSKKEIAKPAENI